MDQTIRQTYTFTSDPHSVYELLMDEKKHGALTGSTAKISRKVGGKFSIYDGDLEGTNLELVPDRKIVQSWRSSDWEKSIYSKATFLLEPVGDKTRLTFTQTGVPPEHYEDLKQGWIDYYWAPMKQMF